MRKTISPIAIDLGGMNTGLYLSHYLEGSVPSEEETQLVTVVMPEEGGKMTWSQVNRTATRHRIRSNKRAKLAKRLLKVIIEQGLKHSLDLSLWRALSGLLNRRGYNRTESELDLTPLSQIDSYHFAQIFPDYFNEHTPLDEQWFNLQNDSAAVRELTYHSLFSISKKDAKNQLFTNLDKEEQDTLLNAYHCLQHAAHEFLDNVDFGHQHRRDYLKDIEQEIHQDSRFTPLLAQINAQKLHALIGNISNLQLRALRWYFNDEAMKTADYFDDARLKSVYIRWLKGWHPDNDTRKNKDIALASFDTKLNALDALTTLDPKLTIPPYEDQNNRRPPKDQTLWLNPSKLTACFSDTWQRWANNLKIANLGWDEGIEENLNFYERKSRLTPNAKAPDQKRPYHDAIFLQRILDRSKALDPYSLRLICKSPDSQKSSESLTKLSQDLGAQHLQDFLTFAKRYYQELELAKQGLWFETSDSLFESAMINPPSKKKILHILVGNILGESFNEAQFEAFITSVWQSKVIGQSSVRSICQAQEECRKEHGNLFNSYLNSISYKISRDENYEKQLKGAEKDIWKTKVNADKAANKIAEMLGHSDVQKSKYNNPFSLAQLFTLIETDRHGFSKTTLASHQELKWRMQPITLNNGEISARCSRLVADTIRPFDGVLRRVLERQAYEIANLKVSQIVSKTPETKVLQIPIIAEENRFTFSIGLADLKKDGKKRKKLIELQEKQSERWLDKDERIKAQNSLCPYTGDSIGQKGEIDHIIPRSYSKDASGTVFDSEANLIWCSRKGNQEKKDKRYSLIDLSSKYLHSLFGTDNVTQISQQLEQNIARLSDNFLFQELSKTEQRDVRHALFLNSESPAYQKVRRRLATQQSSRVNGTQAWLVRCIMQKITQQLSTWCKTHNVTLSFVAARVSAEKASTTRRLLASYNEVYQKATPQPVASHAIDAICALAVAASDTLNTELALGDGLCEDAHYLASLIPSRVNIKWVERKARYQKQNIASQPLFKEGIYAEDFLAIWCSEKSIVAGFDPNTNAIEYQGKTPTALLDLLQNVADTTYDSIQYLQAKKPQKITINKHKAFSLLAKVAKTPATADELALAKLLDALRYSYAKKECKNKIYDQIKKEFLKEEDILKDKLFDISVDFTEKQYGKFKGKVRLPAFYDWKRLLKTAELQGKLGQKGEDVDWHPIHHRFFGAGSKRAHSKTRRVFSLPMIDSPSGGYRIARKTPNGEIIWQLMAIEGTGSAGFAVYNHVIDWNSTVAIAALQKSNAIAIGDRYKPTPDTIVGFDKWLTLLTQIPGVSAISMAPGTKDRRYIRITQPFDVFQTWLSACEINVDNPLNIACAIKVDANKFAANHQHDVLGKPRSNLFIEQVGSQITYWYIVESSASAMKEAYQEAYHPL